MQKILPYLLSIILLISAIAHLINPDFYAAMIPNFIPIWLANVLAAIAEAVIGILMILPKYRHWGGLGFLILMTLFLPIHIWDLFKENPAIGAPPAPIIRLALQFLLIYAGWWIFRKFKPSV